MPLSLVALSIGAVIVTWTLVRDRMTLGREAPRMSNPDIPLPDIDAMNAHDLGDFVEAELAVIDGLSGGNAGRITQDMFARLDAMMEQAQTLRLAQDRAALALYTRCLAWFEASGSAWLLRRAIAYGDIYALSQDAWRDAQGDAAAREMRRRLGEHAEALKAL